MNDLINNPNYLAYKFNFETENIEFLPISPVEIRRVSALKLEYIEPGRKLIPVPLAKLTSLLINDSNKLLENPPRFIFHTAFCASTFLSRCLDVEGVSTSLREPQLLLDAANAKRLQWRSKTTSLDYRQFPKLALLLLRKHARPAEKLIIKPINSVNNIMTELSQLTGSTKSLLLYNDARSFMLSTLRKGEGAKHVIRAMFDLIRCDFPHLANLSLSAMIHMTDWNIILTLWRLQIEQAEATLKHNSTGKTLASLNGEDLVINVQATLQAANQFLELGISAENIHAIVNSDKRFDDAKTNGQKFSIEKRDETYRKLEEFYGPDLQQTYQWMLRNNPGVQMQPKLNNPLMQR